MSQYITTGGKGIYVNFGPIRRNYNQPKDRKDHNKWLKNQKQTRHTECWPFTAYQAAIQIFSDHQ